MGPQSLYLNSGIQGHSHLNLCQGISRMACRSTSMLFLVSSLQGFPGMGRHRGIAMVWQPTLGGPASQLGCGSSASPETHSLSYMNCEEGDSEKAELGFLDIGCKGAQGQTTCIRSGPGQCRGAPALSSNDAQFWGRGCWKMGHLGSIGLHPNWGCWVFFLNPRSWGTHKAHQGSRTQSLCACAVPCTLQLGLQAAVRGAGVWGSHRRVYWALILDPVRFYPGLGMGGVSSPSSVCQWRICWLNKAVSSSWLTAPFWSNLLTFFLIFLNSKH